MDKILKRIALVVNVIFVITTVIKGLEYDFQPYNYMIVLFTSLLMLWFLRKNFMLFIIFFVISYSNYSIIFANFLAHFSDTLYTTIISEDITIRSINIISVFNSLLFFLIPWDKIPETKDYNVFESKLRTCGPVAFVLVLCMVVVFFIGYTLPKDEGQRGHPSPVYEYALSFFLVYFHFFGDKPKYRNVGLFFVAIYALQNFIFGGRIYGLQFILGAFIMLFMHKIEMKKTILGVLCMFVLFSVIGATRGAFITGNFSVSNILLLLATEGFALDTAYSAYYTSQTFVYTMDILSEGTRLGYFKDFFLSIFFGESANNSAKLISISRMYMHHSGGGVLPFFFYFYFGTIGIYLQALILYPYLKLVRNVDLNTRGLYKLISVFVVAHAFRWYLYSPLGLFRGVLFLTIVYFGCTIIYNLTTSKR